jgi:hypothetical protein
MKNLTNKLISAAILCFLFLASCSGLFAQITTTNSDCFTVSAVAVSNGSCNTTVCGNNLQTHVCDACVDVTICIPSSGCGVHITGLTITSSSTTDCHSVCTPTTDFVNDPNDPVGQNCSWSDPRTLIATKVGGFIHGDCATFRICCNAVNGRPQTYTIAVTDPNATCNGYIPCSTGSVRF